jgi:hypothetical protein
MMTLRYSLLALLLMGASSAHATQKLELMIKDHRFSPATLEVAAGEPLHITVKNQDPTPEEFESHDLDREKIIPGNAQAVIKLGPLKPGSYAFFGEFNQKTAQGTLVVK